MVSNGEIRSNVTERIRPFRLKLFGYTLLYGLIVGTIAGIIGAAVSLISNIVGIGISAPIGAAFNLSANDIKDIASFIAQGISSIVSIFTSIITFILTIGFMKEILLSMVNDGNKVSPVDFLKLGFADAKRLAMVYLRLILKALPATILILVGSVIAFIGGFIGGGENIAVILALLIGGLIFFAGVIWAIVILLLYQTVGYELVYDEVGLSAKEILVKARETIQGHIWQWTRMTYFYAFIISIIVFFITIIFVAIVGISVYITTAAGNGAVAIGILLLVLAVIVFTVVVMAATLLSQYFSSKNILNLDELYKAIQIEKREEVSPV